MTSHEREKTYQRLEADWSSLTGGITTEEIQKIRETQIPILKSLKTGFNTSALTIVDIVNSKFLYADEDIEEVTGIPHELYFEKGSRFIFTRAYSGNLLGLINSIIHQTRFFSSLPKDSFDDHITNREICYVGMDHAKRWILHQVVRYFRNEHGRLIALAIMQTRIDHLKSDEKFRYYIYKKSENKLVYPKPKEKHTSELSQLTPRERDILSLMSNGYKNQEIADRLSISFHTVRTHRKNIMRKMNCKNIVDLVQLSKSGF